MNKSLAIYAIAGIAVLTFAVFGKSAPPILVDPGLPGPGYERIAGPGKNRALLGQYTERELEIKRAIEAKARRAQDVEWQADAAVLAGNLDEAVSLYRRTMEMSPKWSNGRSLSSATCKLTLVYLDQELWREALEMLDTEDWGMGGVDERAIRAICHYRLGDARKADKVGPEVPSEGACAYEVFVGGDGSYQGKNEPPMSNPREREAVCWFNLGIELTGQGLGPDVTRTDRGLRYLGRAVAMYPDQPAFCLAFADELASREYLDQALEMYAHAKAHGHGFISNVIDSSVRGLQGSIAGGGRNRGRLP